MNTHADAHYVELLFQRLTTFESDVLEFDDFQKVSPTLTLPNEYVSGKSQ